ncbi:hypothetical protein GB928_018780 [Shinella curvata]|uniref:Uncharacterized protein n=1 Tax=Shinella curvata TaxID=1817964 RepID=A0ABT8XHN2_9HYPH|nr:hypothetical protein [Shinella curvata]MCJ8053906.1 hypothetical protein [Shinella curvata]MDO6123238.1 hypothetical protein [Shinella curvata]
MTEVLIGKDSTGVACVKITKGAYDPITTSDERRERFYFSSKWTNQLSTPELDECPYVVWGGSSPRYVKSPASASASTFGLMRIDSDNRFEESTYYVRGTVRYPDVRYSMPVFDLLPIWRSNDRYRGRNMRERTYGASYGPAGVLGGFNGTGGTGTWSRRMEVSDGGAPVNLDYGIAFSSSAYNSNDQDSGYNHVLIVYNLPGNNTALDGPALPSPNPEGKETVLISSTQCKVAKPGYDVDVATPSQLAFDATGRPLNVIAAADIAIPLGASSFNVGITLPALTAIDMSCYDASASEIHYPMKLSDGNSNYGVEYWTDGSLIRFNNTKKACRARFIVYGYDPLGPSSGANDVLRQFDEGGENVTQFLRPGAASNPRFSDIILDSRRPVIQILADGYFSVPTHTGSLAAPTATTVSYDAAGFFPYVKYMTVHGSGLTEEIRAPRVNRRFQNSLSDGGLSGDGSYCRYSQTEATFYTAKGRPRYTFYREAGGGEIVNVMDEKPMVGIRWFVLGIPLP